MSNLALRALSALVVLPLLGALVLWQQPLGFGLLVVLVSALALHEYAAIMLAGASPRFRALVVALGALYTAALYLAPASALVWTLGALVATAAVTLIDPGEIPAAGARLGAATFSVLYVGGLAAPLALLQRDAAHGRAWVLLAVGVTFGNDTGAYFGGRAFGRHKLYPKVSPAKTVEGGIGGLVASLVIMFAVRATARPLADGRRLPGGCAAGCRPGADRRSGRIAHQAVGGGQGLRPPHPRPRRHARPHRRSPVRRRLDLRLRRPPEIGGPRAGYPSGGR